MNGNAIDIIITIAGVVIIVAGFVASLIYCTRRDKKDWRVIVSVPIVIAVLLGVSFYGFAAPAAKIAIQKVLPGPEATIQKLCDDDKNGDYGAAYDLYASDSPLKQTMTRDQAIQSVQQYYTLIKGINSCTVNSIQEDGDSATGVVTVVAGNGAVVDNKVVLKKEGYDWKVVSVGVYNNLT